MTLGQTQGGGMERPGPGSPEELEEMRPLANVPLPLTPPAGLLRLPLARPRLRGQHPPYHRLSYLGIFLLSHVPPWGVLFSFY